MIARTTTKSLARTGRGIPVLALNFQPGVTCGYPVNTGRASIARGGISKKNCNAMEQNLG